MTYGTQGGFKLYRSNDNGNTWKDLSEKVPESFSFIYGYQDDLYAVFLSDIFISKDDGDSWSLLSSVDVTGNGALLGITSYGNELFLYSNRASIFKSTDKGKTWVETIITYETSQVLILDFAAAGDRWVVTAVNLGAFVSLDSGISWQLKNPQYAIGNVHASGNEIFGTTIGTYKLNESGDWNISDNGLPQSSSMKSITSFGNILFGYAYTIFEGYIYSSSDNGNSWKEVASDLPTYLTTSLNDFITVNQNGVYCYLAGLQVLAPGLTGIYKAEVDLTSLEKIESNLKEDYTLFQNYPNPFNPTTKIKFHIKETAQVKLNIFDITGKEVARLVDKYLQPGSYSVDWNVGSMASGVYFYRLEAGENSATKKLLLLK